MDHPVYRYRDIEKLGRICKTEGSWTKTWPLEQLCTMCAPLVRLLFSHSLSFQWPADPSFSLRSTTLRRTRCHFSFDPVSRGSPISRLIRYISPARKPASNEIHASEYDLCSVALASPLVQEEDQEEEEMEPRLFLSKAWKYEIERCSLLRRFVPLSYISFAVKNKSIHGGRGYVTTIFSIRSV